MNEERGHGGSPKGERKKDLGLRIVVARKRYGWSQKDLAQRLRVPRERLGKWERGVSSPDLEDLLLLSQVLALPLWELGFGKAPEESLSPLELKELARHFMAVSRLLKPWLDPLRMEPARNTKSKGFPAS
jgi:transcriptional regulator with XRE-family HTH domain